MEYLYKLGDLVKIIEAQNFSWFKKLISWIPRL